MQEEGRFNQGKKKQKEAYMLQKGNIKKSVKNNPLGKIQKNGGI